MSLTHPVKSYLIVLALGVVVLVTSACSGMGKAATPTRSPLEMRGKVVFETYCARCHGTSGQTVIVGPSLEGVATRAGNRIKEMDAEGYIRNSILQPDAYTVEGFVEGTMPGSLKDDLSADDLEAVMAFLLTLK
jgi:mono/diheme cytochrome c family protein